MELAASRRRPRGGREGGEVMRASLSDGEVSAMGGRARGPLFFNFSCQFGLMRLRGAPVLGRDVVM